MGQERRGGPKKLGCTSKPMISFPGNKPQSRPYRPGKRAKRPDNVDSEGIQMHSDTPLDQIQSQGSFPLLIWPPRLHFHSLAQVIPLVRERSSICKDFMRISSMVGPEGKPKDDIPVVSPGDICIASPSPPS